MDKRDALVQAYRTGSLLAAIREGLSSDSVERKALVSDLAALHNEGMIDLIGAYSDLSAASEAGPEFFLLRHILEEVLPELEAPVPSTARCVQRLYREAGTDILAGTILDGFRDYCVKQPERVEAALEAIESAPGELSDLLVSVLVAGSRIDPAAYADEAIQLVGHPDLEIRRRAVFSLGRLELAEDSRAGEQMLAAIERTVEAEDDEQILGNAIRSAFALSRADSHATPRLTAAIATALARGGEIALHSASEIFGFHTLDLSPELLALLLERLAQVKVVNKGTLRNIDYGVANLLQGKDVAGGLHFLEAFLFAHSEELDFSVFDKTARTIRDLPKLRSRVATRWLVSGESALCKGVKVILDSPRREPLEIEVDVDEFANAELARLLFAARKAIGYLFLRPISAASFVLSLLRQAPADDPLRSELEALLWDPLLINFSGNVAEYLSGRADNEDESVREAIRRVLDALEQYLAGLRSVGEIPALHPSLEHRDAYRRHFAGEMAQSLKKAEAESVFMQLARISHQE